MCEAEICGYRKIKQYVADLMNDVGVCGNPQKFKDISLV